MRVSLPHLHITQDIPPLPLSLHTNIPTHTINYNHHSLSRYGNTYWDSVRQCQIALIIALSLSAFRVFLCACSACSFFKAVFQFVMSGNRCRSKNSFSRIPRAAYNALRETLKFLFYDLVHVNLKVN